MFRHAAKALRADSTAVAACAASPIDTSATTSLGFAGLMSCAVRTPCRHSPPIYDCNVALITHLQRYISHRDTESTEETRRRERYVLVFPSCSSCLRGSIVLCTGTVP